MKHKTDEAYEVSFNEFGDDPIAVALALLDARHALTLATQRAETAETERDKWYDNAVKERVRRVSAEAASASADAEADTLRAECEALRQDAALLDWLDTKRGPYSRRPMREVIGSEWRIVFTHPSNHTPTLREALTAAMAVQPTTGGADE